MNNFKVNREGSHRNLKIFVYFVAKAKIQDSGSFLSVKNMFFFPFCLFCWPSYDDAEKPLIDLFCFLGTHSSLEASENDIIVFAYVLVRILTVQFQFLRDREKGKFNLICNGKNGIFVDGIFHKTTLPDGDPILLKER